MKKLSNTEPSLKKKTMLIKKRVFFLWNGTVVQVQEFFKKLNNPHPTIKFDFKYSKTNGMKKQKIKECSSAYPRSLIKRIPYNQALHLKKIYSETRKNHHTVETLSKQLIKMWSKDFQIKLNYLKII